LFQCWWLRQVGIVVVALLGAIVASVGDLTIVKRFETEIEVKDRDKRFPTICIKV
jgi:hypothetical protein